MYGIRQCNRIFFMQVRLVHSLVKYFFKFQLWYWIQIYTTKYSNLLLIILILVWIVCSTYRKGEILMQKWHMSPANLFTVTCHTKSHLHSMWSILCIDHIRHLSLSVYRVCYFLVPHAHVLCMGSGSATGFFYQVRLVHSLLKYFVKFQLWYWIQIYTTKIQIFKFVIDNSDISLNCLQHIQKRRNFDAKVTCHQPICLLLHDILSGVGVY